jgi:hypothetical protein
MLLSSQSPNIMVDPDVYNINLDNAAKIWKASVSPDNTNMREAGIPYLDVNSKDYFVDDVNVVVSRKNGGMGMELLELAGGRDDGFGITIVTAVSGNAQAAGVLPGDSIASMAVTNISASMKENTVQETIKVAGCECLDFDRTMDVLANFPGNAEEVTLSLKRIRRWPKVQVTVEYPPSQCAEGVDNVRDIELFAGENLKRALQNRGIVFDDPRAPKCDFCGGKCTVSVSRGMKVLSPIGLTESKLMARNPTCRVSTRTVGLKAWFIFEDVMYAYTVLSYTYYFVLQHTLLPIAALMQNLSRTQYAGRRGAIAGQPAAVDHRVNIILQCVEHTPANQMDL